MPEIGEIKPSEIIDTVKGNKDNKPHFIPIKDGKPLLPTEPLAGVYDKNGNVTNPKLPVGKIIDTTA